MDLTFYIYSFLREQNTLVNIPKFGVFYLEKKHAIVDESTFQILPPSEMVSFEKKEVLENIDLIDFISQRVGESFEDVQNEVTKEVEKWNRELALNKKLILPKLGEMVLSENGEWFFIPEKNEPLQDYFGLEAIKLDKIKRDEVGSYFMQKSILWIFLVVVPLVVLVYLSVVYQDLILGESSFENTHRIEKKDKSTISNKDTLRRDSVVSDSMNITPNDIKK